MRLKQLRKEKGLTQREAAVKFNLSFATYNRYENNEREPDFETLCMLADYFGVSLDYLLERTDVNLTVQSFDYGVKSDERVLIDYYRRLSSSNKLMLFNVLKSVFAEAKDIPIETVQTYIGELN